MSGFIRAFTVFPKEMFRLNNGRSIRLRWFPGPIKPEKRSFDILTTEGKVLPKALDPQNYISPNGASMRPNTPIMQNLARTFKGASVCIYSVPPGTPLPSDLILVHEYTDHYSLQPREEMTVEELNHKITNFLQTNSECLTREKWRKKYPHATETA
ncbi:hypothetical protein McanMca71_004580 [Microsporum canis]|uniref:Tse2 ADP-ribosyltransferase toxin domain-containing protein n=1 Tax=Arthroderma otae (strain ATCC MYA-4605 / CBS 113480) TaxID=554155 RepID=C5FN69_ARTOC|nr:conserved hypothetical protein [Microsporum canis CBS 113480]EEQ31305.1 conserved hypothetical protein [Microsporum canis CBS 113480]